MKCREFLNEFEERGALSETARLHLNDCAGCKKTSERQTRVWQMIERLEIVDAPADFNFRVKARIANAKSSDFEPRLLPALRYVLPLSLAVLLFAFVVFNGVYFVDDKSVPQVAEVNFQPPNEKGNNVPGSSEAPITPANERLTADASAGSSLKQSRETGNVQGNARFVALKNVKEASAAPKTDEKDNFVGSRVLGSTVSNVNILQRGINLGKPAKDAPSAEKEGTATTEQILSDMLGMEIVSENGVRKVASVKQNSIAYRSGIEAGDVIEAIDGKKLSGEPIGTKTIAAKKLTIAREGKKTEISLIY